MRPPQRNVLFLGRLSEEKGLLNLLEAWHQLQQEKKIGVENWRIKDEKKIGQESRSTAEGLNLPSNAGDARERGSDFQVASGNGPEVQTSAGSPRSDVDIASPVAADAERITLVWYEVIDPKAIEGMNCIKVPADANPPTDRRAIKDVFQGFGRVENEADGRRVIFPAKSAGKMLGQSGIDIRRHVRSFAELFRKSIRAWSEKEAVIESHKQHRNITAYHQYIVKTELAGSIYYVRFTVREDAGGKVKRNEVHSSTISRVTVYKAKGAELSGLGHAQVEDSTPFVDNKISYFLNGVKGAEREKKIGVENRCTKDEKKLGQENRSTKEGPISSSNAGTARERGSDFQVASEKNQPSAVPLFSTPIFSSSPRLILAGPDWGDYKKVLDEKIAADHIENVEFTGSAQGEEKDRLYREADIFVLPSPMENFSMVVLEALAYGVPVIATKGTPWRELEGECGEKKVGQESRSTKEGSISPSNVGSARDRGSDFQVASEKDQPSTVPLFSIPIFSSAIAAGKCGCWIDQGVAPLREALSQLLNLSTSQLRALGANGRTLAARKYQWPAIAETLLTCYKEIAK